MALLLAAASVSAAEAQRAPSADSLVAHWLVRGTLADWQPHLLFTGCPNLQGWQKRGVEFLLRADLTPERRSDLARAWMIPLRECHDARVEEWYFDHINQAGRHRVPEGSMLSFWKAMQYADSPSIRRFLRDLMLDVGKPEDYRNVAGATLFGRLAPEERLQEYLRAFETTHMPNELAWGQTDELGKRDPERLFREVGSRVRVNPQLAEQAAFRQLVQSVSPRASPAARQGLSEDLRAGLNKPGLTATQRDEIEGNARSLAQPSR
jgi:ribosomal protein S7